MARSLAKERERENILAHNTPLPGICLSIFGISFISCTKFRSFFRVKRFHGERERERRNTHMYTPLLIQVLNFAVKGRSIRWNKERWRQRGEIIPGRQIGGSIRHYFS